MSPWQGRSAAGTILAAALGLVAGVAGSEPARSLVGASGTPAVGELVLQQWHDPRRDEPGHPSWRSPRADAADVRREHHVTRLVEEWADLRPGMNVAELGAGGGFFTVRFARAVQPSGLVWAGDEDPRLVRALAWERNAQGIYNIVPYRAAAGALALPPSTFDLVTSLDAPGFDACAGDRLHAYVRGVAEALRPGGRWLLTVAETGGRCGPPSPDAVEALARGRFELVRRQRLAVHGAWRGSAMLFHRR